MKILFIPEAAEILRVSRRTLDGWIAEAKHAGVLFSKMGDGRWYCLQDQLEKWVRGDK